MKFSLNDEVEINKSEKSSVNHESTLNGKLAALTLQIQ
jgi:hypothetical protein